MFNDLKEEIKKAVNNDDVKTEALTKIHPEVNCYMNSVNVFVGRQGAGKGVQAITEIIKISRIHKPTHMLIYVSKYGTQSDKTFESMKHLIKIPIEYVKYDDAVQEFSKIQCFKRLYEQIKAEHLEDKISSEQREEIFETLHISDFNAPALHTLILLDDVANNPLIASKHGRGDAGFFSEMLGVCRHIHCSFFLTIQFWKSITTEIKANASTIYIFGGYSKQQLSVMLYQIPTHYSFEEIYDVYRQLQKHDCLIIDVNTGEIKIQPKEM